MGKNTTTASWSQRSSIASRRAAAVVLAVALSGTLGGCEYLNLRNSFLDPSQVGRFDKSNPWGIGEARPVKWPILETLDVVDEPQNHWTNATDPTPADLEPDTKEYTLAVGDVIRVNIYELLVPGATYSTDGTINELNTINIMNLGNVKVTGLTPSQLEQKLAQLVIDKGILPPAGDGRQGPQVTVTLLGSRQRVFSMLGSVGRAGTYNILSTDFRVLDAMALAGDVPVQPGMDYLYIIRQTTYGEKKDEQTGLPLPPSATTKSADPMGAIQDIERSTAPSKAVPTPPTMPAPPTVPASSPQGEGPRFLHSLPEAMVVSTPSGGTLLAQADTKDLEAALGGATATTAAATATTTAPATATMAATITAATTSAPATTAVATTAPSDTLLEAAMSQPATSSSPQYVFVDGKLVLLPGTATTAAATGVAMAPTTTPLPHAAASAPGMELNPTEDRIPTQRVIRIPIQQVREGNSRYNIVIRPGDVVNVPGAEPGEFYLMGHVAGGGVYSLTGRKVTLKQAVAAARGLDGLALPRRCELIRRVGTNQEVTVQVNLQAIFDGEQPDMFLKPNDVVNVGTDMISPFLAVTRNAYRAAYGWGYTYDKNLNTSNNSN